MIVFKVYREEDRTLTLDANGTEPIFTVRSKTMSGIYSMLEMLQKIEDKNEWI
jgi:hypothetical protein